MVNAKNRCETARLGRRSSAACVLAAAAALTGCSSLSNLTGGSSAPAPESSTSSSDSSFTGRVKSLFSGGSWGSSLAAAPAAPGAAPAAQIDCPSVDYRQGAATLAVNDPKATNLALSLRYQASFIQTARECVVRGADVTIKVGIQGRVVIGPAGASGTVSLPLRYALVREGLEPKTIWTKLFMVPATIPDGQLNVPFIHIEEEMTVPIPPRAELDAYVIYIGFDPDGAAPPPKPKPAARPRTVAGTR